MRYKKRGYSEDDLQIACMRYTRLSYPKVLSIHVPNGGSRSQREGERFKRMGVLAGVCDVLVFEPRQGYNGLAIELKIGNNKSTEDQLAVQHQLVLAGWLVITDVRAVDAYKKFIDNYLKN